MAKTSIQILAEAIAKRHQLKAKDAQLFAEAVFEVINEGLKRDKLVKVKGLGTFKVLTVKPRESVNVNTGARVLIEGHDKVSFTPDASMKELVNKPFSQFETVIINEGVELDDIKDSDTPEDTAIHETVEEQPTETELLTKEPEPTLPREEISGKTTPPTTETDVKATEAEKSEKLIAEGNDKAMAIAGETGKAITAEESQHLTAKTESFPLTTIPATAKENKGEKPTTTETIQNKATDRPNQDTIQETTTEEESNNNTESISRNRRVRKWSLALLGGVAICVCLYFAGYHYGAYIAHKEKASASAYQQKKQPQEASKATPDKTKPDTTVLPKPSPTQPKVAPTDEYAEMNNNPKIRYGAYNIIGIDKIVVLKKGQTMESYSRKTLGPDMVGYFQVLNGTSSLKAGDSMKVPKVELRPQYRK
ncbi:HU family DNA-binding protein [Prevotella dentasini]